MADGYSLVLDKSSIIIQSMIDLNFFQSIIDCALLTIDEWKKQNFFNASLVIWHTICSALAKPKRAYES